MSEDTTRLRILNLEDNPVDRELIHATLTEGGLPCEVLQVESRADFSAALESDEFDVILADYSLPSFDGLSALKIAQETSPDVPFILVSGVLGEETAIEALKSGATDYVLKQRLQRLVPAVQRALRESEERKGRKRAEEALRQSEELHRTVVEQAAENIFLVDIGTKRILEANPAFYTSLGYTAEEIRLLKLYDIVAHDRDSVDRNIQRVLAQKRYFIGERKYRRKDGSLMDVEVSTSAISYGGRTALCVVAHDITERKRTEEILQEARETERRRIARDMHDEVLQDLVHALRTIQMRQGRSGDENPELKEVTEALRRSVVGLRTSIYDLRLEGDQELAFVDALGSLVKLEQRRAVGCELGLSVEEGFDLPISNTQKVELLRIMGEALANARRHSGAGEVRVAVGTSGHRLWAEVADDGRGFDAEKAPAGTGIRGMRERVRALGGHLEIRSEPGEGTKVRFEVVLKKGG